MAIKFGQGIIIGSDITLGNTLVGQSVYTTPGTYSWTAPAGVTSVCVVCIGGGGAGHWGFGYNNKGLGGGGGTIRNLGSSSGSGGGYGGGAGSVCYNDGTEVRGTAGSGAVRIIWGVNREFPSFNTNVY